jgi:hypothetical protein
LNHPWNELGKRGAQTDAERIAQIAILKLSVLNEKSGGYSGLTFEEIWDRLLVEYAQWQEDCNRPDPGDDATPLDPALRNKA